MNIKFNNKIARILLGNTVAVSTGASLLKIEELSNNDFEKMKVDVDRKKIKLNKNNRSILEHIHINKYNIQCLNHLMNDNKEFYQLYGSIVNIDNIYSAKFFAYELQNKKEIEENLGCDFLNSNVHRNIKSEEELNFKLELLKYGIKNSEVGHSIYFANILKEAKNMDEALYMLEHTKKYGIMPSERKNFQERFGIEIADKMLEGASNAREKFNLNLNYISTYANTYNEPYNIIRSQNALFRFDPQTGEIVTLEKDNQIHNFKNGTTTKVSPFVVKSDPDAFLDDEKLLDANIKTLNNNGKLIDKYQFRRSEINGEFELVKTGLSGINDKIGLAEIDKKRGKHIEKHLSSIDGTITDYIYADDRIGNRYFLYKITDNSNNILYKSEKKFKVLSSNHFQSTTDGISFDILFQKDNIIITKLDGSGERIEYKIKDFKKEDYRRFDKFIGEVEFDKEIDKKLRNKELFIGNLALQNGIIEEYTVDRKLVETLKDLSGEEWFSLKNSGVLTIISDIDKKTAQSVGKAVQIGRKENRLSTLEHEFGHEKFNKLKLNKDEKFLKIYNEEKDLFLTKFPDMVTKQAGYFMRNTLANGKSETAAEANSIINTPQQWSGIGSRALFLQQYFPKTIAYLANRYQKLY